MAVGRLSVPLRFRVTGCGGYEVRLLGAGGAHPLAHVAGAGGTRRADVPTAWLAPEDGTCRSDAAHPLAGEGRLEVTCADANRRAEVPFAVSYAAAEVAREARLPRRLTGASPRWLFAGADPAAPFVLSPSWLKPYAELSPLAVVPFATDGETWETDPLARPRLAALGGAVFITGGCDEVACPTQRIHGLWPADGAARIEWTVSVPGHVVDLARTGDGELAVLSQRGSGGPASMETFLTRLTPGTPPSIEQVLVARLPRQLAATRLARAPDGRLAFVTLSFPAEPGPVRSMLHRTDGLGLESEPDPTGPVDVGEVRAGGGYRYGAAALSPDASAVLVNGRWLGAGDAWAELATTLAWTGEGGGAAWTGDALALWQGSPLEAPDATPGRLEVFERAPPHARRFALEVGPLPGAEDGPARLHGVIAVGEHLVLTTGTGVRVLDRAGSLVAGADPLPCRRAPTALAVRTGPTTFAFAAGDLVLVFDLSALAVTAR